MDKTSLGDRMKGYYEVRSRYKLMRRQPVVIRVDGRAFHTLTKNFTKPFDENMSEWMASTGVRLVNEIQGAKCAYVQSDEISVLITDFDRLSTDAWFDYNIQKMTSISAATASWHFTTAMVRSSINNGSNFAQASKKRGLFDSRVFNIPKEEVNNYFVWRQQDWVRNSLQMLSGSVYSHKELYKKNQTDMHEMLYEKDINWADLPDKWKNGVFINRAGEIEELCPQFSKDTSIINNLLIPMEE